ncbi:hypothetical protein NTE_02101 [Candidatus Nitrososphaera evergladensis SR1]|uniref:Uncharacterized protein n=1 Tax=Candidatus Nitrososphaera evergladensis SR1 TaxID=1459636 RepID=A0A075MRI2_9ARCH|nr:hypothetical protein [Candidatus Nitrososphaera evergladensis]AIF84156.1 hypothetical protein NTE_02101 [Candidatus Nitrososphaera evergladensis SR1]
MTLTDDLAEKHEKDIELMQRMYLEAERQFVEFNFIVPYVDNDDQVYSPRLVSLLQVIGSQIDGILKILAGLLSIDVKRVTKKKQPAFTDYTQVIDRHGLLSVQQIRFKENGKVLTPFKFDSSHTTDWRKALNDTKHELPKGAYSGQYGHVVNSIAALAILHELVNTATHDDFRPYILNSKNWFDNGVSMRSLGLQKSHDFCRKKSQVFEYAMWFTLSELTPTLPEPSGH